MSLHNRTCWRDLKRNRCYLLCRLPFGLLYFIVEYPFVLLYNGISMWLMIFSDGIVFKAAQPRTPAAYLELILIFPIIDIFNARSGYMVRILVEGISRETDAIYGGCYIWCMLSNGLLYYIVEYPCRGLFRLMVLDSKLTNFAYRYDSRITMGSQGEPTQCIVYWYLLAYCIILGNIHVVGNADQLWILYPYVEPFLILFHRYPVSTPAE